MLRADCDVIVKSAIRRVQPGSAVQRALSGRNFNTGRIILVSVGKAGWSMAKAALECLPRRPDAGIVITKYDHSGGALDGVEIWEAGHPVPDENSFAAARRALELTDALRAEDTVIFLLSGGGSALFEQPLVAEDELKDITGQLLASGADIVEMNTIRKRLSGVKGGRFAQHCAPAKVVSVVLSDIIGDPLDMIASGPAYPDGSTCEEALSIAKKYGLRLSEKAWELLGEETPRELNNVETMITGSVRELCSAAAEACRELGYEPIMLSDCLTCQAKEAGSFLASVARSHQDTEKSLAFLAGGETVVYLTGHGKGGRNQELALSAAEGIAGLKETAVLSVGSDGTDGPTDAAGGFVTGETRSHLEQKGIRIHDILQDNDAYRALEACGGLIVTGATGTNVNDIAVVLIRR
ncbi:MAG: glycerate kinase [Eubacteriales bacterium]|nr:glycerate kinase [Eubacteriales bacterium]